MIEAIVEYYNYLYDIFLNFEKNQWIREPHEIATVIVSVVGGFVTASLSIFFGRDIVKDAPAEKRIMANLLSRDYMFEVWFMLLNGMIGLSLFLNWGGTLNLMILFRPYVAFLTVVANVRLAKHVYGSGGYCEFAKDVFNLIFEVIVRKRK